MAEFLRVTIAATNREVLINKDAITAVEERGLTARIMASTRAASRPGCGYDYEVHTVESYEEVRKRLIKGVDTWPGSST